MKDIYIVTCPLCGKMLLKGKDAKYIESKCPQCKKIFYISMNKGCITVAEDSILPLDKEIQVS